MIEQREDLQNIYLNLVPGDEKRTYQCDLLFPHKANILLPIIH